MKLPLFPLHMVLFPGMALPLHIFEARYRKLVNHCLAADKPFGVVLIRSGVEAGGSATPYPVGTTAHITRVERLPDGRMNIEALGQERFKIESVTEDSDGCLSGEVDLFPLSATHEHLALRSAVSLAPLLARYLRLLGKAAQTTFSQKHLPSDPVAVAYLAAIVAQIPMKEKQELLGLATAPDLLQRERAIYRREVSLLRAMLDSRYARDKATYSPN